MKDLEKLHYCGWESSFLSVSFGHVKLGFSAYWLLKLSLGEELRFGTFTPLGLAQRVGGMRFG